MNSSEIRLKEHLGIVTSDTSTTSFSFFLTPLRGKTWVGKEDYVIIEHPVFGELCPLLALIRDFKNYETAVGTTVNEKSVQTIASAEILGYVDLRGNEKRPLEKLYVAPNPGSKVYLPYSEFLEDVFTRNPEGKPFEHALYLGNLDSHAPGRNMESRKLRFFADAKNFTNNHSVISAITGAGKTHMAVVIVEELANKVGWPVVILDAHGEYTTVGLASAKFKEEAKNDPALQKDYPFNFRVVIHSFRASRITDNLEKSGITVGKSPRFSVKAIQESWMKTSEKNEVEIKDDLKEDVRPNNVTIISSEGLLSADRRNLFTNCLNALWRGRREGSVKPFLLVVEEASAIETETLERVASEGRKLGVTMCLLSQHLSELSVRVSSQLGFQLMGRTTDSDDLESLRIMAGEKRALLPGLMTGEWIANGISLRPIKISVRNRYSAELPETIAQKKQPMFDSKKS